MDDVLEMIDCASGISVDVAKKRVSKGALYVLFMLCLSMHSKVWSIFAVDSFDHALNPRLAKKMMQVFCEQSIENNKHVFLAALIETLDQWKAWRCSGTDMKNIGRCLL